MLEMLWLVPALPFAGFLALALSGGRISRSCAAVIGIGSVCLSTLSAIIAAIGFISSPPPDHAYSQTLWTWMRIGDFKAEAGLYLDALSLTMILVITFVAFLIHIYSSEFMEDEEGYSRFFACMNLFVGSMLILVLADNLLLLYLGWEGVGLCSYLLIGFWYKDPSNGYAARKAFVVTRVGDAAFVIGIFLLYVNLGTLGIQELMQRAGEQWSVGSGLAVAVSALLLGGAVGKSAQLPLQTWLPDAMAGPTPVSALIHAATLVTAGVYLIARTHVLFHLAPAVQSLVAVIGAATLLLSGFSALTQRDIKRVLAYSTISQIGYMFLALGVGAWSAAIFHFMTHAFFKALLFLCAGAVIASLNHEHDMFRMGGLRRQLPVTFWTFLIGASSLSALPLVTAGFYSKDEILFYAWSSASGNAVLWTAGLAGAFLTSLYVFRMLFITFFGESKTPVTRKPGFRITMPLIILAALSISGGFLGLPGYLRHVLPEPVLTGGSENMKIGLGIVSSAATLIGILAAYTVFLRKTDYGYRLLYSPSGKALHRLWFSGWGFDRLYDILIARPYSRIAGMNRDDFIDLFYLGFIWAGRGMNSVLSASQNGKVRWYAAGVAAGAILTLAVVAVFL
jgi:NADH-quinone oxidoreductase subunit L